MPAIFPLAAIAIIFLFMSAHAAAYPEKKKTKKSDAKVTVPLEDVIKAAQKAGSTSKKK